MTDGTDYIYRALGAPAAVSDARKAATLQLLLDYCTDDAGTTHVTNAKNILSGGTQADVLNMAEAVLDAAGDALIGGGFDDAALQLSNAKENLIATVTAEVKEKTSSMEDPIKKMVIRTVEAVLDLMSTRPDLRPDLTSTNL